MGGVAAAPAVARKGRVITSGMLPVDLEKAYDELFMAIRDRPDSAPVIAERTFKWVMCSRRPLTSDELVAAVCQDPAINQIQQGDIDIHFVLYACSNLLVVDPTWKLCGFTHLSVQEYLERRVWSETEAHALASKTCLGILLAESTSDKDISASSPVSEDGNIQWATPEAADMQILAIDGYAVEFWHKHIIYHGEAGADPRVVELLKKFFGSIDKSSLAYRCWQQRAGYPASELLMPNTCTLLCICFSGLDALLSDWWDSEFDIESHNADGQSLLQLAVKGKSHGTVLRLLDRSINPNTSHLVGFEQALTIAVKHSDASMVL
jgi:hypothetical protein